MFQEILVVEESREICIWVRNTYPWNNNFGLTFLKFIWKIKTQIQLRYINLNFVRLFTKYHLKNYVFKLLINLLKDNSRNKLRKQIQSTDINISYTYNKYRYSYVKLAVPLAYS